MTTIDPSTCPANQPYEGTHWGARYTMQRIDPGDIEPWEVIHPDCNYRVWAEDDQVSNLVPLAPARPITRDDLPTVDACARADDMHGTGLRGDCVANTLDAVVDHLNARGGVPTGDGEDWKARAEKASARPTLDRDEVREAIGRAFSWLHPHSLDRAVDAVMSLCYERVTDPSLSTVTDSDSDSEPLTAERHGKGWDVFPTLWGDAPFWTIDADGARKRADRKRAEADWYARAAVAIEKAEADEKAEAMERAKAEAAEIAHLEMGARWLFEHGPGYPDSWDDAMAYQRNQTRTLFRYLPAAAQAAILDSAREGGAA